MPVITYKPSTSHWLFPPIIIGILIILLVIILIMRIITCIREGTSFFPKMTIPFFEKGGDKLKLFGTIILFLIYIFAMQLIGFLTASILLMFLYGLLYTRFDEKKTESGGFSRTAVIRSILISFANSVATSVLIWFLFARVLRITLP